MNALNWYVNCNYIRGGRSSEGLQVEVDEEEQGILNNAVARWLVTFAEKRRPQQNSDEEEEEEEEEEEIEMTSVQLRNDILSFCEGEGVDEKDGSFVQIKKLRKGSRLQIINTIWRMLTNELGDVVYKAIFQKTVSVRR